MSTTTMNPEPVAAPEVTRPPAPEMEPLNERRAPESEDVPADRTAMLFWIIAFAILAFIVLCDLLSSLLR